VAGSGYDVFRGIVPASALRDLGKLYQTSFKIQFIQINQPTRCIDLSDLLLVVQIHLNMFRASFCPSPGTYKLQ
jgi:hypothetical protein